jgi:ABC-2 type transport system permease protein
MSTRSPVLWKAFRDARMTAYGGGALAMALGLLLVALFPSIRETLEGAELPDWWAAFGGQAGYLTPPGFLAAEFFTSVPVILMIFALIAGTGATAGEESAGTLDLLLAHPVRRRRVILEKAAGIGLALTVALLAGGLGIFAGQLLVEFELSQWRILASLVLTLPLLWFFLAVALFAGAWLPNRAAAVALSTLLAVASYVLDMMAVLVEWLRGWERAQPFWWADVSAVLMGDWSDVWRPFALLGATGVVLAAAVLLFERRDIAAGGRSWRWRRRGRREVEPASAVDARAPGA